MAVRTDASADAYTRTLALGAQSNFTVCGWWRIDDDRNAFSTAWSLDNGTSDNYIMETNSDGTTMLVVVGVSILATGPSMTVGVWYFLGLSVSGASGTLIWRAETASSFSSASWGSGGQTGTNFANFRINNSPWTGEFFNGCVAGVKLWMAALTAAEMDAESWQYLPRRTTNLTAWYPLLTTDTTDYSGGGQTLTAAGTLATEDGPPIPW